VLSRIKKRLKVNVGHDFYSFLNHSKNYVTAELFSKGLIFLSIPIFTRLLIPEDYGVLAILTSFIAVFSVVYGLGIRGSVTRYYYEKTDDFDSFYGSNILLIILWGTTLSFLLLAANNYLVKFFKIPLPVIIIGIFVVFFTAVFQLYQAYLIAAKKSKKLAKFTVTKAFLIITIGVILTLLIKENRYYGKAVAQLIVALAFFIVSIYAILKISKVNFKKKHIKYSLLFGLPIVAHLISHYILKSFDQIIINQLLGKKATGLYSLAYNVGMIQNVISMGMLRAWSPVFYEKLNEKKYKEVNNLASKYSKIVFFVALLLILFSRELIMIMADKQYHAALNVVPIIIVAYTFVFLYTMYVNFAFYHKKTYLIALFTMIAGIINIGLNYLLIPRYGYQVAAWTTLLSYACLFIMHYFNVKYIIKSEWMTNLKVFIPGFLWLLFAIIIFYLIVKHINNNWILFIFKFFLLSSIGFKFFGKSFRKMKGKV
jgi:O-antigen/teichoic acid export membrane protein